MNRHEHSSDGLSSNKSKNSGVIDLGMEDKAWKCSGDVLEVLESHVLQQRGMTKNQIAPLFFINSSIMLCVCLLKCLQIRKNSLALEVTIKKKQDKLTISYAKPIEDMSSKYLSIKKK